MVTAQELYDTASALNDDVKKDGTIDTTNEAKAPYLINILQKRIAKLDGTILTSEITALTDTIKLTDEGQIALTYALAMKMAKADGNEDAYQDNKESYYDAVRSIRKEPTDIEDGINVLSGMR